MTTPLAHGRSLMLILAVCFGCFAAWGQEASQAPQPPPGVMVELLPRTEVAGAAGPDQQGPLQQQHQRANTPDPNFTLAYDGITFGEVLEDLGKRLDVLILCDNQKVLKTKYYRHTTVPRSMALELACRVVIHYPRPAYLLCTEQELRQGDLCPEITDEPHIRIKLQDAVLAEALAYLTEVTDVAVAATPTLGETKVSYEAEDVSVGDAVAGIAAAISSKHTTGFVVEPIDIDRELARIESMPDAELERLVVEGIRAFDRMQAQGSAAGPPISAQEAQMAQQDGMRMFFDMDPADRQQLIQRGAQIITRVAGIVRRLSPETQAALRQRAQPFLGMAVAGYMALPGDKRGELSPIMQALRAFGW